MNEKPFEKALIRFLKKQGYYVKKMTTTIPGFPDLLVERNNVVIRIEVKCVNYGTGKKAYKSMFKKTQFPFYYDYCKDANSSIMFVTKFDDKKTYDIRIMNKYTLRWVKAALLQDCVQLNKKDFFTCFMHTIKHVLYANLDSNTHKGEKEK